MIVSLIVAMDEAGGIGKDGRLPWHLRSDLQRFKELTHGHHVIMGRRTYQAIGHPLSGRINLVVTRHPQIPIAGCTAVGSLEEALAVARQANEVEAFVIGGSQIYRLAWPLAGRLYLTRVHTRADCDVFFPAVDFGGWLLRQRQPFPADAQNDYPTTFEIYEKAP